MKSSIVSYPLRGNYGKSNYRGNVSGLLIKDLLLDFKPRVFADPCAGSGTSGDVVKELNEDGANIEYYGLDLHSGFNLIKDSLTARIGGQRADYVFLHPAYGDLIKYSGEVWGSEPHPDDLSRCENYEDFLTKITSGLHNIFDALKPHARYSILIGDIRRDGNYLSIQSDLLQLAPGKLEGIIIKQQHNCWSNRQTYPKNFTPIMHEYLLTFRKTRIVFGMLDAAMNASQKLEQLSRANWAGTIAAALIKLGGEAHLQEIYKTIEKESPEATRTRKFWKERVRAEVQKNRRFIKSDERGIWAINPNPATATSASIRNH